MLKDSKKKSQIGSTVNLHDSQILYLQVGLLAKVLFLTLKTILCLCPHLCKCRMVKYWSCLKLMFLTEVKQVMFCLLISAPVLGTNILFHGLFSTMFYSVSLITREVQMKTTPVRMTVRKKDNTCWQGGEERGTLVYCQWKCKVAELLWKM